MIKFKLKRKLLDDWYLSSRIILLNDVFISFVASFVSVFFLNYYQTNHPLNYNRISALWLIGSVVFSLLSFWMMHTSCAVIRHTSLRDVGKLIFASVCKGLCVTIIVQLAHPALDIFRISAVMFMDVLLTICLLVFVRVCMLLIHDFVRSQLKVSMEKKQVFIYGVNEKSLALAIRFMNSTQYHVCGLISPGHRNKNISMANWKIFYYDTQDDFNSLVGKYHIDAVIFATEEDVQRETERLIEYISKLSPVKALIAPPLENLEDAGDSDNNKATHVRQVNIEDLLGRPEINISMDAIVENFRDKVIMVTGAAGSIGSELCRQLAGFGVKQLILFDNAETPMHNVRLEFEEKYPHLDFVPVIGDVRLLPRLDYAFRTYQPQVVFHAAAYKHVPLMEENPCEAILVNAVGSRNVANKCMEYGVEKMVMISTDKAVNPTNIMGCTKRLAEIYVQSLGLANAAGIVKGKTRFVTTRFGNVLGSNGSVIPRFREQIAKGGPVTVTHPEITRFFMTIPEACRLVMEAATMTSGNEIFVFDMGHSVKIVDLAKRMIELAGLREGRDIHIEFTGLRPGEKLYEEVLSNAENTSPTNHDRIRIAKVRKYDYTEACEVIDRLETLSRNVEIAEMVKYMKQVVPEYKSNNSVFEKFDKK